jgi:hypothetical protein
MTIIAGTGGTLVGNPTIGNALQRVVYIRITNIGIGTESYMIY